MHTSRREKQSLIWTLKIMRFRTHRRSELKHHRLNLTANLYNARQCVFCQPLRVFKPLFVLVCKNTTDLSPVCSLDTLIELYVHLAAVTVSLLHVTHALKSSLLVPFLKSYRIT